MSDYNQNFAEEPEEEESGAGLFALLGITEPSPMAQTVLPAQTIRIQSSAGGVIDVPVEADHSYNSLPGYALREVLEAASITSSPSTQYWLGEAQITLDTVIAPGATVTGIGLMKGG